MAVDSQVLIAIIGMSLVTIATRLGGFWLAGRIEPSPRIEALFQAIPGAVIVAIVAPAIVTEGINGIVAASAAMLVMRRTGSLILTFMIGVGMIWLLRSVI